MIFFLFLAMISDGSVLLDDFSDGDAISAIGTRWQFFTDGVMGGVSTGSAGITDTDGGKALRLAGTVSLENNGGFIQTALPLAQRGYADVSQFTGIRLRVKGNGERYYLHMRTDQTRLPWMYFAASFNATEQWQTIEIPFSDFRFESGRGTPNLKRVSRIAVVAAKKAFDAEVYVDRLEFYTQ